MTITLLQPAAQQARRMYSSIGRPQISCSGLGRRDFIRVLLPAARMTAVNDINLIWPARIRTLTRWTKTICATVTPRAKENSKNCRALLKAPCRAGEGNKPIAESPGARAGSNRDPARLVYLPGHAAEPLDECPI